MPHILAEIHKKKIYFMFLKYFINISQYLFFMSLYISIANTFEMVSSSLAAHLYILYVLMYLHTCVDMSFIADPPSADWTGSASHSVCILLSHLNHHSLRGRILQLLHQLAAVGVKKRY